MSSRHRAPVAGSADARHAPIGGLVYAAFVCALGAAVFVLVTPRLSAAENRSTSRASGTVLGLPVPEAADDRGSVEAEEEDRLRVGRDAPDFRRPVDRKARLIRAEPAQYPEELAGSGVSADVQLSVLVDRTGRASHIRVEESPDELFTTAALDAVAQWEWQPALKRGRVTNERVPISIPVSEEHGDRRVFDYLGGRVALLNSAYAVEVDAPAQRRFGVRPVYPFSMLVDAQPGEVVLELTVGEDGFPVDLAVIEETHREFGYAALGAFRQWKYDAARARGLPIPGRLRYRVSFQPHEFGEEMMQLARALRDGDMPEVIVPVREIDRHPRAATVFYPLLRRTGDEAPQRRKVSLSVLITPKGEPMFPQVEAAPDPVSGYEALAAIQYWRFTPAIQNRQPVYVHLLFPMTF